MILDWCIREGGETVSVTTRVRFSGGCFIGPAGKLDETLLFETCAVEGRSVAELSRYRSLKAARVGHKRWVTVIRKELACDDGGAKEL